MYLGDFVGTETINHLFTTVQSTGAPTTLAGTPKLRCYKNGSTTESSDLTPTVDFDFRTGLNLVAIDLTGDSGFYATGNDFNIVITAGTVNSVSVVGYVVGAFSILHRSPLRPTTAGRTLDVSAGGEAGMDWANVGSPTTTVDLSGTTIKTTQKVDVDTIKTNPVVNGGTITFPTTATLASTTNITAGTITTTTNLTNAPTAGDFTATMKTSIGTAVAASAVASVTGNVGGNVVGSVGSVTGAVGSVTGAVGSVTGAVGSVTGNVGGNVTGSVGSVVGAVGSVTGNVGGNVVGSVASVTAAVAITSNIKKNQALAAFEFLMTDSTNHNPSTGLTVSVTRSIDGGAFAAGTLSAVSEIASGMYAVDFGAGDLNGKVIVLKATAASSDTRFERIVTQP